MTRSDLEALAGRLEARAKSAVSPETEQSRNDAQLAARLIRGLARDPGGTALAERVLHGTNLRLVTRNSGDEA